MGALLLVMSWLAAEVLAVILCARWLGALATVALFIGTSLVGALLLRREGMLMAMRALGWSMQLARTEGEAPPLPLADSIPRLLGGLLLLCPGFVTDLAGVLLMLPPLRGIVAARVHAALEARWRARAELYAAQLRARWHARGGAGMPEEQGEDGEELAVEVEGFVFEPGHQAGASAEEDRTAELRLPPPDPQVQ
ncbi:MAG: hypothetical protein KatS3mg102_2759 [Planctomycetota bacterium]|nr:MAG: hypothetical protein KatS3mg102_2759 [Planctomycetota bacterium]